MRLPTMPEFKHAHSAFAARFAPSPSSDTERLAFLAQLEHLLELAMLCGEARQVERAIGVAPAGPFDGVAPALRENRLRNAGWFERLKREEEMGGTVPWPPQG